MPLALLSRPPGAGSPPAARRVVVTAGLALAVGVAVELLPRAGSDLAAQAWWASWAATAGDRPVDLGWYAGTPAVSYSLLAPWVLAWLGPAGAGVLATAIGAAATTSLLDRAGAGRPWTTALVTALCFGANQLAGRTTFALGVAAGLLALVAATGRPRHGSRLVLGTAGAALAGALSPVAAVLVGVGVLAWWLGGGPRAPDRSTARNLLTPPPDRLPVLLGLLGGALVPLGGMAALGAAGGPMPADGHQLAAAGLAALVVLAVAGPGRPVVAAGALLTVALLAVVWVLPEPLGSNTTRLVLLFAVPVVVASADRDRVQVALAVALVTWLLPPVLPADLVPRQPVGPDPADAALLAELDRRGPVGRIEVVPLADHSEAAFGRHVPLARGWTRQLDTARNALFHDGTLDAGSYLAWLRARGVSYVASADRRPDWAGRAEAELLRGGVPGLTLVWAEGPWSLWEVDGPGVVLTGPARVVASDRSALTVRLDRPGTVELALFWHPRLTAGGDACLSPGPTAGTVLLHAGSAGAVTVSSAWWPAGQC